ncbi:peptidylprolyl isomerase [Ectothiorhodospiraceae bacterium BW-2]|nr:peptidylprolyl isomerase [Ectothiorhodospiraceae bacterium BW-2]
MLNFIRNRAQSWIAWVIVGLIIIPFALFGLNQYMGGGKDLPAATVNGSEITKRQLESAYYRQRTRLQEMFGGELPANLFSEQAMKQQILQRLIEDEIVLQQAAKQQMRIGAVQLAQEIRAIELFHNEGQFDPQQYETLLARQGMSPAYFEGQMAQDMLQQQFRNSIHASAFITPTEAAAYYQLQHQQRDVGYLLLQPQSYLEQTEVAEADIEAFYQQNLPTYRTPERISINYLELNQADLAVDIAVEEAELQSRYEAQKLNYRTEEERSAAHILLEVGGDEAAVKAQAEELYQQLQQGADFAALAQTHSQDPGSASQGGELGFFGRGVMDDAFEEAVFTLQAGEISQPIRSSFGYHLIKLNEIRGGESKSFAEVKDQLKQEIQQQRSDEKFYDLADKLANLAYEHPDSLVLAAEEIGLKIQTSELFSRHRGGGGITDIGAVRQAAFNDEVLLNGYNSEVVELDKNHIVVVRVNERIAEQQQPLEEVRTTILEQLRQQQAVETAQKEALKLQQQLAQGGELDPTLSWERIEALKRSATEPDPELVRALFKLPHPEQAPLFDHIELADGRQAVVALYRVITPELPAEGPSQLTRLQQALSEYDLQATLDYLRSQAEVVIPQ